MVTAYPVDPNSRAMMSQVQAAQNAALNRDREKMEKLRVKKTSELDLNLTNMLIHLYNGKPCNDFIKEYKAILDNVSVN